jgi:protein-S-isoprenylcysteine O-methyltransferase Ste14
MLQIRQLVARHPMLVAWLVLAIGMVAMLLYTARDVDLLASQRLAMVLATVGLAGACVWILTWD